MLLIVVPEAPDAPEHHLGRGDADGAVSGIGNDPGGPLDPVNGGERAFAVQNILQQLAQLAQSDPAGDTFAAGLGVTKLEERRGHVHGTQAGRACHDAPLQVIVQLFNGRLSSARGLDRKSAQNTLSSFFILHND